MKEDLCIENKLKNPFSKILIPAFSIRIEKKCHHLWVIIQFVKLLLSIMKKSLKNLLLKSRSFWRFMPLKSVLKNKISSMKVKIKIYHLYLVNHQVKKVKSRMRMKSSTFFQIKLNCQELKERHFLKVV